METQPQGYFDAGDRWGSFEFCCGACLLVAALICSAGKVSPGSRGHSHGSELSVIGPSPA